MKEAVHLGNLKLRQTQAPVKDKKREKEVKKLKKRIRRSSYAEKLQQAGLFCSPLIWLLIVGSGSIFVTITITNALGPLVGFFVGPGTGWYFLFNYLTARAEKRRRLVVPNLPGFLDTLAASLSTGYSMEVSIEHSTNSLPEGVLKTEFIRVVSMMRKGITLEESLDFLARRITGQEVVSLIITIRLFSDMGGRVLTPFQRLGYKMREQQAVLERANRDLVGTKQAFYVIFTLSLTAPVFMFFTNPGYMRAALNDSVIQIVLQIAFVIQFICFIVFKKFTTLKV